MTDPHQSGNGEPKLPSRGTDLYLILVTAAIALVAVGLLVGLFLIRSGMQELRREAFPTVSARETSRAVQAPAGAEPDAAFDDEASAPTSFLAIELKHQLAAGLVTVFVDDQIVHEAALFSREKRAFLFRTITEGELRAAIPVDPGTRRIRILVRSDGESFEVAAEATTTFEQEEWKLLAARLRPEDNVLELRWRQ